jgi:hypothetical protein
VDEAVVRLLARLSPETGRLLDEHRTEYGELLTTLFLGELANYAFAARDETVIDTVNDLLIIGSPHLRNALLTGFVEGVPINTPDEVVRSLPEPLRTEVARDLGRPI